LLSASLRDEFGLFEPARRFSERLDSLGIEHQFLRDEGGHFDAAFRLATLVRMALEQLNRKTAGDQYYVQSDY